MSKSTVLLCVALALAPWRPSIAQDAVIGGAPDPTDSETRMSSWDRHVELHATSAFKDLEWRAVGPRKQGGRIEAIAVAPGKPGTIYVGPGSGNLWKTTNNGTTWRAIFEKESTFAIGDVAVAPSDPNILWVGTGEVLMARSSYAGTGVFKSTDAGETWRNMGLNDTHHIGKVLVDPMNPDVVYVAAIGHLYSSNEERGVFKTTDGGRTWTRSLYIGEWTGAIDLVMDPSDGDTLYATSWERSRRAWGHTSTGSQSGVWKTSDGGENWRRLEGGLPSGDQVGRIAVDVSRSNPNVLYALIGGQGDARGVYRSDDKGENWIQVNQENVAVGYDFCIITISPDDENEIYLPGQRTVRSTDGGKTYRQIEGTLVHLLEHGSRVLHLDAHEFWIDPSNADHLLLGNDGGFHVSHDRGRTWLHYNNLPIGEFYAISVDMQTPYNIYGGTQDNAALFGPSSHVVQDGVEDPWKHVYLDRWGGGDSYFTHVDPTDPRTIYYEHQFGDFRRANLETGETRRIQPRAGRDEEPLRYNWMTPFILSQFNPYTLYYGANKLFKSIDRGDSWVAISPDLTTRPGSEKQGNVPYGTITSISESPIQPGLIYVGTDDGVVQVTRDDGDTWTRIDAGLPGQWVTRVVASRYASGTVYVSMTGYREDDFETYLYVSTNDGTSWASLAGNLPPESVNVIREDPNKRDVLYAGTDLGVYVSLDRGAVWHSLCANLPTTPVHDLVVHPRDDELIVGTHGRSIFVLDTQSIQSGAARIPSC